MDSFIVLLYLPTAGRQGGALSPSYTFLGEGQKPYEWENKKPDLCRALRCGRVDYCLGT